MGSLFRLTGDTVTPSAGTRVLKASEAAVLLEANAVLDAARERVADMERKAGSSFNAFAIGAKQFVVQEAAEITVSDGFNVSWFTL